MKKREVLKKSVRNTDITAFDSTMLLNGLHENSGKLGELKEGIDIYLKMLSDKSCSIILAISSNTNATGCLKVFSDLIKHKLVDAIVISGKNIIDIDFFEALGFNNYHGSKNISDTKLRELYINRSSNYFVDEDDLLVIDETIKEIADQLSPRPYSSREFLYELGKYLELYGSKKESIIQTAYENSIPIFCPDITFSRAGYGLLKHYFESTKHHLIIDTLKDLRELGEINRSSSSTGIVAIGEDCLTDLAFNTIKYSEQVGGQAHAYKYALLFSDINSGDRACHSSNLKDAISKGFVKGNLKKHIYMDTNISLPLLGSYLFHSKSQYSRTHRNLLKIYL